MIAVQPRQRGRLAVLTAFVCLLCTLPYWRALTLPAISDTYLQVWAGRHYGPISKWSELAADALYRCRTTSIWLTAITESIFGFSQPILNLESLLLHLLNVCLIASLGRWSRLGFQLSIPAALLWGLFIQAATRTSATWYDSRSRSSPSRIYGSWPGYLCCLIYLLPYFPLRSLRKNSGSKLLQ